MIPPPTVLTLLACHFHAPPHRGSESPSPASYRPRPRSLHSASCGLGPRSSRACPWLRPSFPQLRPRASRRRFQEATPTTSFRTPRPRPPCPLRSLAPPLEAPLGLQAQCGGGGLCALQAKGLQRGGCLAPLQGLPASVQLRSAAGEGNDPDRNPIESGRVTPRKHLPPRVRTCFPHPMSLSLGFQIEPLTPTEAAGLGRGGTTSACPPQEGP